MPIVRNSFIRMSKLTDVKGKINYISSHARQENLYAVYETTERKFWTELAKCNQEEFRKSGTEGKCIEAREFIIALPESFVDYQPQMVLKLFTDHLKQKYDMECVSALHHNKRKTNYHIHLIFAERRLLNEPEEKRATRNRYYDENGKHARTKKEVCTEDGQLREGCSVIKKGEIYERNLFSIKDVRFKNEKFLDEVKRSYTDLINIYVKSDEERLQVFDKNGAYLPMKKIGKNNPKEEQIKRDNEMRTCWNQTVDRAYLNKVPETQIMQVKRTEIVDKVGKSIEEYGKQPHYFELIITSAINVLELLITRMFTKVLKEIEVKTVAVDSQDKSIVFQEKILEKPIKSALVEKYPVLQNIYRKLSEQDYAIHLKKETLCSLEEDLGKAKGIFKIKQRKELQREIANTKTEISDMERRLSNIVKIYDYKTVKEFLNEFENAKAENVAYQKAYSEWEKQIKLQQPIQTKEEPKSIKARLEQSKQRIKEQEKERKSTKHRSKDRGAR